MRITSDQGIRGAIHVRSRGECCSNARADAKFAANLSQVSTFVPIFAAQATMKPVDLVSTNQARHPATGR
jgi:hypothetical protein